MLVIKLQLVTIRSMGKREIKFPCNLCEGNHPIHICPLMDEASKELEKCTASQPHLLVNYQKLSPHPFLVDQVIGQNHSLFNPVLSKSESRESFLDQILVEKIVDFTPPSVNHAFLVESEPHTIQALIVSLVQTNWREILSFLRCMREILLFP